jgi:uridine kinase
MMCIICFISLSSFQINNTKNINPIKLIHENKTNNNIISFPSLFSDQALSGAHQDLVENIILFGFRITAIHKLISMKIKDGVKKEDIEKLIYEQEKKYDKKYFDTKYAVLIKDQTSTDETYFMDVVIARENKRIFFDKEKYVIKDIPNVEKENEPIYNLVCENILGLLKTTNSNNPFIVGMAGCSGTGKSTFADAVKKKLELKEKKVAVISIDDFLKSSEERMKLIEDAKTSGVALNEKNNIRWDALLEFFAEIKKGNKIIKYRKYVRYPKKGIIEGEINLQNIDVLIFEGVYAITSDSELANLLKYINFPIYLDADPSYIKKWRWEQELQTRAVSERRSRKELEDSWELTLKDLVRNIYPSINNAKIVIYININHKMKVFIGNFYMLLDSLLRKNHVAIDISMQDEISNAV